MQGEVAREFQGDYICRQRRGEGGGEEKKREGESGQPWPLKKRLNVYARLLQLHVRCLKKRGLPLRISDVPYGVLCEGGQGGDRTM